MAKDVIDSTQLRLAGAEETNATLRASTGRDECAKTPEAERVAIERLSGLVLEIPIRVDDSRGVVCVSQQSGGRVFSQEASTQGG